MATGPAVCPDANEIAYRVERTIGMPLARAAALRFSVRFSQEATSYAARLGVHESDASPSSDRELRASSCSELADAVAVAIALALGSRQPAGGSSGNPSQVEPGPASQAAAVAPGSAAAPPGAASAPSPGPDVEPSSEPPLANQASLTPALAVSLVADAGSLPGVGLGLGLGAELRAARFTVRASGTLLFDRHVSISGAGSGAPGADMSLVFGSLSACTSFLGDLRRNVYACAGWELGRIEAIGTGVQVARRGEALWSAPRFDLGAALSVDDGPVRLFGQFSLAAPLERDDFFLQGLGSVHRAPAVVGRLAIGADVSF